MRPETWLPTCTVTSAERVPVAVTRATTGPLSPLAVVKRSGEGRRRMRQATDAGHQHQERRTPSQSSRRRRGARSSGLGIRERSLRIPGAREG